MKQRSSRVENPRKLTQPLQHRPVTPESNPDPEPPFDIAVSNLKSKLSNLEEKYSFFMKQYTSQLQDQHRKKSPLRSKNRENADFSYLGREKEYLNPIFALLSELKAKIADLCDFQVKNPNNIEAFNASLNEELEKFNFALVEAVAKLKPKSDPNQSKEWVRKLIHLEEEKRNLEVKHKDYIETLTRRMMAKNDEYQREIAKLTRENSILACNSPIQIGKSANAYKSKPGVQSSPSKSHYISRSETPDLESNRRSRVGRSEVPRSATPDLRQESPISRSVSPAERKIQDLKSELEGCKQKLDSAGYEIDVLKAWKDLYVRNPPDYAELVHHHQSESQYERYKLSRQYQVLLHKMKAFAIGVTQLIRMSANFAKSAKDRDALSDFGNLRSELEVVIRDIQSEKVSENAENTEHFRSVTQFEAENEVLKEKLQLEIKRGNDFAEALNLLQKNIENLGGKNVNPNEFLLGQNKIITDLQNKIKELTNEIRKFEDLQRENRLLSDKLQVEKMTNLRLNEEIEDLKRKNEDSKGKFIEEKRKSEFIRLAENYFLEIQKHSNLFKENIRKSEEKLIVLKKNIESIREKRENDNKLELNSLQKRINDAENFATSLQTAFERKRSELESENANFRAQLKSQSEAVIELSEAKQSNLSEIKALSEELHRKTIEISELEEMKKSAETEKSELKLELENTLKCLESAENQLNVLKKQENGLNELLSKKRTKLKSAKEGKNSALIEAVNEIEKLKNQFEENLLEKMKLEEVLSEALNKVKISEEIISEKTEIISDLQKAKNLLEIEAKSEIEKFQSLETEFERSKAQNIINLESLKAALKSTQAELFSYKDSLAEAKKREKQQIGEMETLKTQSEVTGIYVNNLQKSITEIQAENEKILQENNKHKEEIVKLKRKSEENVSERDILTANLEGEKMKMINLEEIIRNFEIQKPIFEGKISKLTEIQSTLQESESKLKQENFRLLEEKNELSTRLEQMLVSLQEMEKDSDLKMILSNLQFQISEKTEENVHLKTNFDNSNIQNAKLMTEISKLNSEISKEKRINWKFASLREKVKAEHIEFKSILDNLKNDWKQFSRILQNSEHSEINFELLKSEIEKIHNENVEKSKIHRKLREQLELSENELKLLKIHYEQLEIEMNLRKAEISNFEIELKTSKSERTDIEENLKISEFERKKLNSEFELLNCTLFDQNEKYSMLLKNMENEKELHLMELSKLKNEALIAANKISEIQTENSNLNGKYDKLLAEMKIRFENTERENIDLEKKLKEEKMKINEKNSDSEFYRKEIENLSLNIQEKDGMLQSLKIELEQSANEINSLKAEIENRNSELFHFAEEKIELEETINKLQSSLETNAEKFQIAVLEFENEKIRLKSEFETKVSNLQIEKGNMTNSNFELRESLKLIQIKSEENEKFITNLKENIENLNKSLADSIELRKSFSDKLNEEQKQNEVQKREIGILKDSILNFESINRDLERKISELTEEISKLHSPHPIIFSTNSENEGFPAEVSQNTESEQSVEIIPHRYIEEIEISAEPGERSEETLQKIEEMLSVYSQPQKNILETVQLLINEFSLLKKMKSGVVIPKLQLPMVNSNQEVQTSPVNSLSQSFVLLTEPKSSERIADETPQPISKSANVSTIQDQDTPRSKVFPELWRTRIASGIRQVKTEEIYSLHNKIKSLESDLAEEAKIREHLDMQIRLLKEEVTEKERQIRRAGMTESGGEQSAVNLEHLKELLTKLILILPLQYLLLRNSNAENLITTIYSVMYLSQKEVKAIEETRKGINKKKGLLGMFQK